MNIARSQAPNLFKFVIRPLTKSKCYYTTDGPELTFIMVKPDGVQRGLVGKIIDRFERKGFQLVALKLTCANKDLLREHYSNIKSKPFFSSIIDYMSSGPVVPMVWQGEGVIAAGRTLLGETDPANSRPGTVRGDFAVNVSRNVCHGSDSAETAKREIKLWFDNNFYEWNSMQRKWLSGN